ncbi:hypothetical protein PMI14_05663 [Acidovorax sp. CF316]|uniref:Imm32 family immunity protein n=1 Tax=Acidovorax sp. CF316 TaxID=1144317 RepID=UPI00026BEC6E|nr:hypothetical protein [Acidovorax sp. CF316]EJE49758.1 hypothetical protein PMI14_05663 [Acidovorax sp. CF316]
MKLHGYADEGKDPQDIIPETLAEVTLEATPDELRAMAAFLLSAADAMDRLGGAYGHLHLADAMPQFNDSPHLTVFRYESGSDGD